MRRIVLAVAVLCGVGLAPAAWAAKSLMPLPPRSDTAADEVKWAAQNLDISDWLQLSIGEKSIRYMAPSGMEREAGRDLRVWVRGEFYDPQPFGAVPVRSALTLTEYDCDQRRFRELAEDDYPYNNLQGSKRSQNVQDAQWEYPRPATVGAIEMSSICQLIDEVDAEAAAKSAKAQAMPQGDATYRTVTPQN
jgi:hypothetical protein